MIFYGLSGFLMAHLYLPKPPTASNIGSYARARFGRVVPLYVALVVASVLISNVFYKDFRYALPIDDPAQILRSVLFIEAPWELWTIPVEMQFYLAFVIAWRLYPRLGKWALVLTSIFISVPAVFYRSEEHTSELQSLMRISYAVFCLKKKKHNKHLTMYT